MNNDISEEWKVENQHIRQMSQPFELKDFLKQYQQRHINVEFRILSFMTQTQLHINKLYKNPGQFPFNRYPNVMTFDHTRVILGQQENRENAQNYINANVIQIDGKKVIASQGPLNNTFFNFWRMVEQHSVDVIFMLCSRFEGNHLKCDLYWPTTQLENSTVDYAHYRVKLLHQENSNKGLHTRQFLLINTLNNYQRTVTQYQLTNWSDGKCPSNQSQQHVKFLLDSMIKCFDNLQIPLVHCSAGIGRTGTFIAMAELKMRIKTKKKISIFEIVRKLREQRWGMVYTQMQYSYLYQFVKNQAQAIVNDV